MKRVRYKGISYIYFRRVRWLALSGFGPGPPHVEVAAIFGGGAGGHCVVAFFALGACATGVPEFYLPTVRPAVALRVPCRNSAIGSARGRHRARGGGYGAWKTETCDGRVGIGECFREAFVGTYQLLDGIVF